MADDNANLQKYKVTVTFVIPDLWSISNTDELRGIIKDELFDDDFCDVNSISGVQVSATKLPN